MGSPIWDSAMNARSTAQHIDHFLFVDGKTSPKIRQYKYHTTKEYIDFIDSLREGQWEEYNDLMREINGE